MGLHRVGHDLTYKHYNVYLFIYFWPQMPPHSGTSFTFPLHPQGFRGTPPIPGLVQGLANQIKSQGFGWNYGVGVVQYVVEFEAATPWGQLSMSEARSGKMILALEAKHSYT